MADIYTPSRVSHHGSMRPLDETHCKAAVWSKERWSTKHQCNRKPVEDGWCKQHHPDAEVKRQAAATAKYQTEQRRYAMGWYGERFMAALIAIRDGDNDPRTTAAEALNGCQYTEGPTP